MDSAPARTGPLVVEAITASMKDTVAEIDRLIKELEKLKTCVIDDAESLIEHITRHHALGAEAIGFVNHVRDRMVEVSRPLELREPDAP